MAAIPEAWRRGDLCSPELPALAQHKVAHTYASGVLKTSKVLDPCDDREIRREVAPSPLGGEGRGEGLPTA